MSPNKYNYSVFDTPGHSNYIKNMLKGLSSSDVAIFLVSANNNQFKNSITKHNHKYGIIEGQTRQYLRICHLLGK